VHSYYRFSLLYSNIFVTVLKHFCYCAQTFLLLCSNIFVTVLKHFCYCAQTFLLLCSNIFVTVLKHFCYCAQTFLLLCSNIFWNLFSLLLAVAKDRQRWRWCLQNTHPIGTNFGLGKMKHRMLYWDGKKDE